MVGTRHASIAVLVPVAAAAAAGLAGQIQGGGSPSDYSWNEPAGGAFEFPLNWLPLDIFPPGVFLGPPGPGEMATFDLGGGSYTVTFANHHTNAGLRLGDDAVTFDLGGFTYTLTSVNPSSMLVPLNAQDDAALTVLNGALNSQEARLAAAFPTSGSVTVGSGGAWNLAGQLIVGWHDDGSMTLQDGGDVTCASAILGHSYNGVTSFGNGVVDLIGSGCTWDVNGNLIIGNGGDGTVTMSQNAGLFTSGVTSFGVNPGATGSLTIGELLSVWESSGSVYLGGSSAGPGGTGTITINPGGVVNLNSFPFFPTLYLRAGSTLNLTGGALLAIVVNEGGTFNWTTGNFIDREPVALVPGPLFSSPLVLDDPATTLGVFDMLVTDDGVVEVSDHATVSGSGLLRLADGEISFETGSDLSWLGGAAIGELAGTTGSITMTGLGCYWSTDSQFVQELNIGESGAGSVQLLDGAVLSVLGQLVPSLGRFAGSEGSLVVSGSGSQCSVAIHPLYVGAQGEGTMTIDAGAALSVPTLIIGESGGSSGEVLVDGTGTSVTAATTSVGAFGSGALTVSSGAIMAAGDILAIAEGADSEGHVVVSGPGSQLTALGSSGYLFVGGASDGTLTIEDGASVHAVEAIIGDGSGVLGTVAVSGADSELLADESIEIGFFGAGSLMLDGGSVVAAPLIEINNQSAVGGDGIIIGELTSAGEVSPGLSAGELAVDGSYTQTAEGQLTIELGGDVAVVEHDVLSVSGDVQLDGTLHVALIDGFVPQPGDCFDVIASTRGAIVGEFASVEPPGTYELTYTSDSVTLCAIGTPCVGDIAPPGEGRGGDGSVGPGDLAQLLASWGPCPDCPADIAPVNGDGTVGPADLAQLLAGWGSCS